MLRPSLSAPTTPPRTAGADMALASTIVFFGIFPVVLAAGLVMVQLAGAFAP